MNFLRLGLVGPLLVAASASAAIADDGAAPPPVKAPAHAAKVKTKPAAGVAEPSKRAAKPGPKDVSAAPADGMSNIKFSDPSAPLAATPDSNGSPTFGLAWHATNAPIDRYDAVRHTSGLEGQGAGVEAGVKIPFFGF